MTVRDFLKRITEEDMDKMMVWSDNHGWANIVICKSEREITIKADYSMPFSDDVCYATGGIVDPAITYAPTNTTWDECYNVDREILDYNMRKLAERLAQYNTIKGANNE